MEIWAIIFLAVAVSLDGFGAGFAYGLNKVTIKFLPRLVISFASALSIYISLLGGTFIAKLLPQAIAVNLGSILLCIMGIYIFRQGFKSLINNNEIPEEFLNKNFIQKLFILLKQPMDADFDKSGNISGIEVFFLGVALAMDAFGAGFGAALAGINPLFTAVLVGFFKMILLSLGIQLGNGLNKMPWQGFLVLMPGLIFFLLGIYNFF